FGAKVPSPLVLHLPPLATVTAPLRLTSVPAQMVWLVPGLIVGAGVKVIFIESERFRHALVAVSISVTVFAVVSPELALYVAFNTESLGVKVPLPVVVHTPVPEPPVILPFNTTFALLAQAVVSFPASTVGMGVIVTVTVSEDGLHVPLCVDVSISFTTLAAVSALLRLYVAFNAESLGLNVPLPRVVQIPFVEPPDMLPLSDAVVVPVHINIGAPASISGEGLKVTFIVSLTALHAPLPVDVSIRLTKPAAVSAELGLYVAFNVVLFGVNAPLPPVLQIPPDASNIPPARVTRLLFLQTVWSGPAFTTGSGRVVIVKESDEAKHPPLFVDVSIKVIFPTAVSALLGI